MSLMMLIWELHITGVYLHNGLPAEFGTIPIASDKKKKKCMLPRLHIFEMPSAQFSLLLTTVSIPLHLFTVLR